MAFNLTVILQYANMYRCWLNPTLKKNTHKNPCNIERRIWAALCSHLSYILTIHLPMVKQNCSCFLPTESTKVKEKKGRGRKGGGGRRKGKPSPPRYYVQWQSRLGPVWVPLSVNKGNTLRSEPSYKFTTRMNGPTYHFLVPKQLFIKKMQSSNKWLSSVTKT